MWLCFRGLTVLWSCRINFAYDPCLHTKSTSWLKEQALPRLQWHTPVSSFILCLRCSLSSSGAMWPGIKTETGLPEAPSGGQPGFLSFTTAYTSNQPGHLHYSYPSQGKLQPHSVSQDNAVTLSKGDLAVAQLCFPLLLLVTSNTVKKYLFSFGAVFLVEHFVSPGSSFTTSSVYSSILSAPATTTTAATVVPQVSVPRRNERQNSCLCVFIVNRAGYLYSIPF